MLPWSIRMRSRYTRNCLQKGGVATVDGGDPARPEGGIMKRKHWTLIVPGAVLLCATPAFGVELRDAVQAALSTNPEIRQAVANRIATQEERVQATGLYYPRVSVEG